MLAGVKLSFSLGATKHPVTSPHQASLCKSGLGSDGEIHVISFTVASQGRVLLFKEENVCLSTHDNSYKVPLNGFRRHWSMAVNNHHPWQQKRKCTFISLCPEQKHLSEATRPWWMQASGTQGAHSSQHQTVPDVCSCREPILKLMASIQLGLASGMTLRIPQ